MIRAEGPYPQTLTHMLALTMALTLSLPGPGPDLSAGPDLSPGPDLRLPDLLKPRQHQLKHEASLCGLATLCAPSLADDLGADDLGAKAH